MPPLLETEFDRIFLFTFHIQEVYHMRKLTLLALPLALVSCNSPEAPPQSLVILKDQAQYQARSEAEINIQGVLSFNPNPAQSPSERVSRYSLDVSGKFYYFYDLKEKEKELNSFVGKNIYVKGKIIDIHINDMNWPNEVWPAVISLDANGL